MLFKPEANARDKAGIVSFFGLCSFDYIVEDITAWTSKKGMNKALDRLIGKIY